MRKMMGALALAGVVASGLTPVGTAYADGADAYGRVCNPDRYKQHYKVENLTVNPTVTYQASYQLGPGEQWTTSKEIVLDRQLHVAASMSYTYSGGGSLSLPGKLLGEIKAETSLSFQASGNITRTRRETTREERRFGNPDNRNHKLIFYKGVTKANGRFTRYACYQKYLPGQSYGPFKVHKYYGKFETWTDQVGLSHVLCGYAVDGRLARLVKQRYCRL